MGRLDFRAPRGWRHPAVQFCLSFFEFDFSKRKSRVFQKPEKYLEKIFEKRLNFPSQKKKKRQKQKKRKRAARRA